MKNILYKKSEFTIFSDTLELDDTYLFNSFEYYKIHETVNTRYIKIGFQDKVIAIIQILISDKFRIVSPIKATFGGFQFLGRPSSELILESIEIFEDFSSNILKAKEIHLTFPPLFYEELNSTISYILLNSNYKIFKSEINHYTNITDKELDLNKTFKKKYKKLSKMNLSFDISMNWEESYKVLKENRENRGVKISMSLDELKKMKTMFNDKVFFFDLKSKERILASCYCLAVNKNIIYVFYWGHNKIYDKISPVILLANKIYEFAKKRDFKIIDVGTSSKNGSIDFGLKQFKESLGFKVALKLSFKKEL